VNFLNQAVEGIRNLSPNGGPPVNVMEDQVTDLSNEVRNLDFRLQFLWNQCNEVNQWLTQARDTLFLLQASPAQVFAE
jgi:hypothetical protein